MVEKFSSGFDLVADVSERLVEIRMQHGQQRVAMRFYGADILLLRDKIEELIRRCPEIPNWSGPRVN